MLETAEFKHLQELERRNKKLIEHYWDELWNKRNGAVLDECLMPDVSVHVPRMNHEGMEEYKKVYEMYASAFGRSKVEIQELIASNDKVVSRVLFSCLHTGDMDGIPASGKELQLQAFTIFRLEHGKIAEEWELFDELGMMQQLGMELHMKEAAN
jgi:steroid delta-isomerase-like uncharacterized protein